MSVANSESNVRKVPLSSISTILKSPSVRKLS